MPGRSNTLEPNNYRSVHCTFHKTDKYTGLKNANFSYETTTFFIKPLFYCDWKYWKPLKTWNWLLATVPRATFLIWLLLRLLVVNNQWSWNVLKESSNIVVLQKWIFKKYEKRKLKVNTDRKEEVKRRKSSKWVISRPAFTFLSSVYSFILLFILLLLLLLLHLLLFLPLATQRGEFNVLYPASSRKSIQYSFSLETSCQCFLDFFQKGKTRKKILLTSFNSIFSKLILILIYSVVLYSSILLWIFSFVKEVCNWLFSDWTWLLDQIWWVNLTKPTI